MARKQQPPQFGTDAAPDNVSMSTLNSQQRPNTNEDAGKSAQTRARDTVTPDRTSAGNPYKSGEDNDSWGTEHSGLLGF